MITFIFVCFTCRLNVTVLSPILYNLACVVDRLNPSLWTVIYSLRVLYLRKPRVISPTAIQAVITTVFCICSIDSSLGLFYFIFLFVLPKNAKWKRKQQNCILSKAFCFSVNLQHWSTKTVHDWQLQLSNQSPRPACLLDFVFVLIFLTIIKKHI